MAIRTTTRIAVAATLLLTACGGPPSATPTYEVATQDLALTAQAEIVPSSTPEQPTAAPPTITSPAPTLTPTPTPTLAPLDLTSDIEAIHSLNNVVLPKPAGAEMRVSL